MLPRPPGRVGRPRSDESGGPLLPLTTAAEWRGALEAGAVTPPSLGEAGFVHLSTRLRCTA